jgi:lysozyme
LGVLNDIKRDEGLRLKPYRCTAGKLTIGYGRNLDDNGISPAEAEAMLAADVEKAAAELAKNLPWLERAPEDVKRGLINMSFNLGWPRLSGFKQLLLALETGAYAAAAEEAMDSKWAKDVGERAKRIADLFRKAK